MSETLAPPIVKAFAVTELYTVVEATSEETTV